MLKNQLRKLIKQRKRQFSQQQLGELSFDIIRRLSNHTKLKQAGTVLLYHSLPDEVYTHDLIQHLYNQGKTILLPVVINESDMELCSFTGNDNLKSGAFNIWEPQGERFTDYNDIDVAIIPGIAFDDHGNRLGRGKGYYDRLLARMHGCYKIGVCFNFQKVPLVPAESTDIAVDEVL